MKEAFRVLHQVTPQFSWFRLFRRFLVGPLVEHRVGDQEAGQQEKGVHPEGGVGDQLLDEVPLGVDDFE